jgi:hypothetical protein
VKGKLIAQYKLIPITMADGISLLFSDVQYERDFMVWFWELMLLYAEADHPTDLVFKDGKWIFDVDSTYPMRYSDGPIPIHISSELVPYTNIVAPNPFVTDSDFAWTWTQMMLAALALQYVCPPFRAPTPADLQIHALLQ